MNKKPWSPWPVVHQNDGTALLELHRRDGSVSGYAVIDEVDAERLGQRRWFLTKKGYAARALRRGKTCLLHREVLGISDWDGLQGDHIDRDKLNNRRSNLRVLTNAENEQNVPSYRGSSSKYRGVSWDRQYGNWAARVGLKGKVYRLGRFSSEEEAAAVARLARKRMLAYAVD